MGLCCLLVPDNWISSRLDSREPILLFSAESGVTSSVSSAWNRKFGVRRSHFSQWPLRDLPRRFRFGAWRPSSKCGHQTLKHRVQRLPAAGHLAGCQDSLAIPCHRHILCFTVEWIRQTLVQNLGVTLTEWSFLKIAFEHLCLPQISVSFGRCHTSSFSLLASFLGQACLSLHHASPNTLSLHTQQNKPSEFENVN